MMPAGLTKEQEEAYLCKYFLLASIFSCPDTGIPVSVVPENIIADTYIAI
jgi:hypothetical protein